MRLPHPFRAGGLACLVAGLALVGSPSAPRADEPAKLRIGWGTPPPTELLPILLAPGIARHSGVSYILEDQHFRAATLQVMAMANGEIDLALLPSTVFGFAVENARLDDLRFIADEFMDGVPGHFSSRFMTLQSAPIRTVEDLKGKVLATNAIGGPGDLVIRTMMRSHHLEYRTDYTVIEAVFSTMTPLLLDRKADLVMITQPFYDDPVLQQNARTLFSTDDAFGTLDMILWVARSGFIAAHRAAITDLLEDYVRAAHWYLDPANHAEAVAIVAKFNNLPVKTQDYLFTSRDFYRNPDEVPDASALQRTLHAQVGLGLMKDEFDIRKYGELGPITEAAQRLK